MNTFASTLEAPEAIAAWLRARAPEGLSCDSRQLVPGGAFVAWPGAATDGRRYVSAALEAGAAAALVERAGVDDFDFSDERILAVTGLKHKAGAIASAFYGEPSAALDVVAFTGTNGKTTSAWWMAQLLSVLQRPCALVGTLGIGRPPVGSQAASLTNTGLTTPDPVLLQSRLRALANEGVQACAIEASSIGLVEGRLNGTRIRVAAFTNFTQDHLDFHGSMQAYWAAKAALFDWPNLQAAVVNVDDGHGTVLAEQLASRPLDVWTVGIESAANACERMAPRLCARDLAYTRDGLRVQVVERSVGGASEESQPLSLPMVGSYNVSNLLVVLACARALGVPLASAVGACAALSPVPGRMQCVMAADDQPLVLVDYAHTPDALEKALLALQPLVRQRAGALWCVVGCGGDRDTTKRPLMAAAAEREADHLVLTSDNPRSEDPLRILAQMQAGLQRGSEAVTEPDRASAIAHAVLASSSCDVVLIAGKGHEAYQEIQGVQHPFSDEAQARLALAERSTRAKGAFA